MAETRTLFRPHPAQARFQQQILSGQYTIAGFGGGIRSGKSYGLIGLFIALCRIFPGSRWAIVRKDLPTLKKNVVPVLEKLLPDGCELNRSDWYVQIGRSQIHLFPASVESDPELHRMHGAEFNGFLLDEGDELPERFLWKAVERAGAYIIPGLPVQPKPLVLVSFNPTPLWPKRLFHDPHIRGELKPPYLFQPATIFDNPSIPPAYLESLKLLPERDYKRFVMGEWTDLGGAALDELSEDVHLVDVAPVPDWHTVFGAFDWGWAHPWVFGWFAVNESGIVTLVDTAKGRRMREDMIVDRILSTAPMGPDGHRWDFTRMMYAVGGTDIRNDRTAAGGDGTPTIEERLSDLNLILSPANTRRVMGLENLRAYTAWRPVKEGAPAGRPQFQIMRTPANLKLFDKLKEVVLDPDNPVDALKTDADRETGEGGDDEYDMVRYALASRPVRAGLPPLTASHSWDRDVLAWETERKRRGQPIQPDQMTTGAVRRAKPDPMTYNGR